MIGMLMSTKSSDGGGADDDAGLNLLADVAQFVSLCKENGCRHEDPSSCYNEVVRKNCKFSFHDHRQQREEEDEVVVKPRRFTIRIGREDFPSSFEYDDQYSRANAGLTTLQPSMAREEEVRGERSHNHQGVNASIPRLSSSPVVENGGVESNRLQVNSLNLQSSMAGKKKRRVDDTSFDNEKVGPQVRVLTVSHPSTTTRKKKREEFHNSNNNSHIKGNQEQEELRGFGNYSDVTHCNLCSPSSSSVQKSQEEEFVSDKERNFNDSQEKNKSWVPPTPPTTKGQRQGSRNPPPRTPAAAAGGVSQQPPQFSAQEFADLTSDLRQRIAAATKGRVANATNFQLAIGKRLWQSDLNETLARVTIPNGQRSEFLTEAEKAVLARDEKLDVGAFVVVKYPDLAVEIADEVRVGEWEMGSRVCVLAGRGWKAVARRKKELELERGDEVELWRFGDGEDGGMMGFVLVNVESRRRWWPELGHRR